METITIETEIDAEPEAVWQVLDDFGSIDRWSPGVRRSFLESQGPTGVGTTRHCDFTPFGSAQERIEEYVPEERMRVSLHRIRTMPISAADVVFALEAIPGGTRLRFTYSFTVVPRARIVRKLMPGLFRGGLKKIVKGLKQEAERVAGAAGPPLDGGTH